MSETIQIAECGQCGKRIPLEEATSGDWISPDSTELGQEICPKCAFEHFYYNEEQDLYLLANSTKLVGELKPGDWFTYTDDTQLWLVSTDTDRTDEKTLVVRLKDGQAAYLNNGRRVIPVSKPF